MKWYWLVEREELPPEIHPVVRLQLQMQDENGSARVVIVTDVSEATITVDANHPLAGKDLTFEIELVEIE